ncbi:MAG: YbjQ family protein [Kordiimonadaceae bacterium]|nr:YbjQ family protein [Kordiimonadaceae bacterium]
MIVTNIEAVPGRAITEELGLVQGSTVRGKHIGKDIAAFFKGLVGGEIKGYSDLLEEGREQAISRMKDHAQNLGADAIVNVRLTTSSITGGAAELMAYGTAVKLSQKDTTA